MDLNFGGFFKSFFTVWLENLSRIYEEQILPKILKSTNSSNWPAVTWSRNFVGIISSVNCSATVCKKIADTFNEEVMSQYPNVDGVVSITHSLGF